MVPEGLISCRRSSLHYHPMSSPHVVSSVASMALPPVSLEGNISPPLDPLVVTAVPCLLGIPDPFVSVMSPQVAQLNKTIEQMQTEFAEMLKETLDKMYDKLDATSTTELQV